jgi:hypothetical protein
VRRFDHAGGAPSLPVLADFLGTWTLERRIEQADGTGGRLTGTATWSAHEQGAICTEQGSLSLAGGAPMQAARSYIWTLALDVLFEDGRFFHAVPVRGGMARHWCAPDHYEVLYDFAGFPASFSTVWSVRGPRKDYAMTSRYTRA